MNESGAAARVRDVIREALSVEVGSDETDLIEAGLIDSLALVTLIAELEQEFGNEFPLGEVDVDQFRSIDRIVRCVAATATAAR